MTCDSVAKLIPLYFYGELPTEEEDPVEAHLHECAAVSYTHLDVYKRQATRCVP